MDNVLDVHERRFDPACHVVCLDEVSRQLLADTRPPLPRAPGRSARHDPEYVRDGVVDLFLLPEPLRGRRHVMDRHQCTRLDVTRCVKELGDVHSPDAERIVLVIDQLDTQSPASFCAAFPPAEAKRLAAKLEIHHTPEHGSWLNTAEFELAVPQRQSLREYLSDRDAVARGAGAWADRRNAVGTSVNWRFTTADARTKPHRLYPRFDT